MKKLTAVVIALALGGCSVDDYLYQPVYNTAAKMPGPGANILLPQEAIRAAQQACLRQLAADPAAAGRLRRLQENLDDGRWRAEISIYDPYSWDVSGPIGGINCSDAFSVDLDARSGVVGDCGFCGVIT
jgi:hypothetical protein